MIIWSKVLRLEELMRPRNVTLPLRENLADDNGEGPCDGPSLRISRDQPT